MNSGCFTSIYQSSTGPWGFTRALFIAVQDDILHTVDQVSDALQAILRHRIEAKLDHPWGRPAGNATNQDGGDGHMLYMISMFCLSLIYIYINIHATYVLSVIYILVKDLARLLMEELLEIASSPVRSVHELANMKLLDQRLPWCPTVMRPAET